MTSIYHVTTAGEWALADELGVYRGDTLDSEGFIHASERHQVLEVLNRVFRGRTGLVLLVIDEARVAVRVVRENLEGGEALYPHLYGPLNLDAVARVVELFPAADGTFAWPPAAE